MELKTYGQPSPNPVRETLFGDMPLEQWPPPKNVAAPFPWNKFIQARTDLAQGKKESALECWREVVLDRQLESRHVLQAWHFLRQQGEQPPPRLAREVVGLVVEVGLPAGLDLLAAYADHTARYYNYSGGGVAWDRPDDSLNAMIDQILTESRKVVQQIGPWGKDRPGPPPAGHVRISFLTPAGLHFGQGPMEVFSRDPLGGQVLHLATVLMKTLIGKTQKA
jgi:hypothetical protein